MGIRGALLDIAGVLHDGQAPYAGAREAIDRLRAADIPVRFVTNTSRRSRDSTVQRLRAMGFQLAEDEVFTAPLAARAYLVEAGLRPFLIIHPALEPDFADLPTDEPNAVFLADAAEYCSYPALDQAFRLISGGAPLVAVGRNRYFREGGALHLDAGAFVAALEYASGKEAIIAGKPAPAFYRAVLTDLGIEAAEAAMIGDDVEADVIGARECGLQACLVRTGKYCAGDEAGLGESGSLVADDLAAAVARFLDS